MSLPLLIGVVVVGCYLCGSIPFGLIIGKLNKIDIRNHGSGNIGATNVLRVLGKKWGYTCFVLDLLKGLIPVIVSKNLALVNEQSTAAYIPALALFCTVLGHVFSLFLGFKGGKGIATSAGAILAIAPYSLLAGLVIWFLTFKISGYVSLASILAAIFLPFLTIVENTLNLHDTPVSVYSQGMLFVISILVIVKHKSNIHRLKAGNESRFKKSKEESL